MKSVAFLIPCYNEELTIRGVVHDCQRYFPTANIYVFDNNSTDLTADLAKAAGAEVIRSPQQGKGAVVRHAFSILNEDIVVVLDGDGTYPVFCAREMIQAVGEENYDMVVCTRKAAANSDAFPRFHQIGNRAFSRFVSLILGEKVSDVFSGYRAFSKEFYQNLVLDADGFEIESELTLKSFAHGFSVKETSGPYGVRPPGSHSKLKTFKDGFQILSFIVSLMREGRPLAFFGFASLASFLFSLASGWAPVQDYIEFHYVYTVPRAILAASLMVLSMMLFGIGLILDSQVRMQRQQSILMRRWNARKDAAANPAIAKKVA